jgi:signal transduction histidine kinase
VIRADGMLVHHKTGREQPPAGPQQMPAHAVVAADADGMIVFWDDGARQIHGLAAGQVVGARKLGDLFGSPLDGANGARDLLGRLSALMPAPAVWAGAVECLHASGHWFTADVVITPFRPDDRSPAGITLVSRPAPAAAAFEAAVMSKLSHELRSPLASIIGLTGVMRARLEAGQADDAVQVRQLDLIQTSATRSLTTIDRVVDLGRLTSGGVRPAPRLLDLRAVVAEVATELEVSAAARGLRLRTDVPRHPVMVTSDPDLS